MTLAFNSARTGWRLMAGTAIVWAALAQGANAEPGEFVDGKLQPLADGFPHRTITIVNVDDPGSRDGIYARALQEAARKLSPVDIVVSDEPAPTFSTFFTLNDIKKRDGGIDGYYPLIVTVAGATTDTMMEPIEKELGMTAKDLNMVLVTETIPYVMIQRKDAPWGKTFDEFLAYAKAHPGELKYPAGLGAMPDLTMEWIMREAGGLKVVKIPTEDSNAAATIVAAGEGDFTMAQASTALQHWQAGKIDVLLVTGPAVPTPWNDDPNVKAAKDGGLPTEQWGAVQGVAVPTDTSKEHVDWLYKLFKAAAESDEYKQREKTIPGDLIKVLSPEEANAFRDQVVTFMDPVLRDLGVHIDQLK